MESQIKFVADSSLDLMKFHRITPDNNITIELDKNDGKYIELGKGAFGIVYRGTMMTQNNDETIDTSKIAVKVMSNMQKKEHYDIFPELLSLYNKTHENIVKYIGYAEKNVSFFIFMELLEGTDLFEYIRKSPKSIENIEEKKLIVNQLLNGLYFLHQNNIYHRDIKPENIFITRNINGQVIAKYIDFGFGCNLDMTRPYINDNRGTPSFMSPELINDFLNKRTNRHAYRYHDLWALGVTLYELFTKKGLFKCSDKSICFKAILSTKQIDIDSIINTKFEKVPSIIINVVKNLLKVNYQERRLDLLSADSLDIIPVAEPIGQIINPIKIKTPLKPFVMRAIIPKFVIKPTPKERALSTGSDKILVNNFSRKHSF
jgi:serine/threonine protein kinase